MACKKCLKSNNVTKPPIAPGISVTERIGVKIEPGLSPDSMQVITPFTKKRDGK